MTPYKITIHNEELWLLPEKGIFWPREKTLILSDLHLGKSGHFRKSGIAAPAQINSAVLRDFESIILKYKPKEILILGDLFHSSANKEWFEFEDWRRRFNHITFVLITGNHDLLEDTFYEEADILWHKKFSKRSFCFVHNKDALQSFPEGRVVISGHVHPGVVIKGKGRQSVRLPCFYISENSITLPAFGLFTGLYAVRPDDVKQIYAIADEEILKVKNA